MVLRLSLCLALLLAVAAPSAFAHPADEPPPDNGRSSVVALFGDGENIEGVKRVEFPGPTEVELAGDWAFVSTDKTDKTPGGLTIVNIADPEDPFIEGTWHSPQDGIEDASFGDVDVSPDGNLAVITNAHCNDCEEGKVIWAALIDTTDKANPKLAGTIVDDETIDYVHTATLDNKTLFLNPQVAAFYPQPGNAHITMFDISDPAHPVKKGVIDGPGSDAGLAHDSYIDHRPDGRTLLYGASVHKSDVFDITDLSAPAWLQTTTSTSYTISHDVQPNHDRTLILVDDEGAAGGQLDESVSACGKAGEGRASGDSGSLHFFKAAPDGTFAEGGAAHLGSFNAPANANTGACVAHVFWQAPDENRLTQAYYRTGAFVIEYEDPASPKALGWFLAKGGARYWSNKPHNRYMYATDMDHGLDILAYTGEGGNRWPTTAGPAEVQRSARQSVPYVPIPREFAPAGRRTPTEPGVSPGGPGTSPAPIGNPRKIGPVRFVAKLLQLKGRRRGARIPVVVEIRNARGVVVQRFTVKRRARRPGPVKVRGVAFAGRYTWRAVGRGRLLGKGKFTVRERAGVPAPPKDGLRARPR